KSNSNSNTKGISNSDWRLAKLILAKSFLIVGKNCVRVASRSCAMHQNLSLGLFFSSAEPRSQPGPKALAVPRGSQMLSLSLSKSLRVRHLVAERGPVGTLNILVLAACPLAFVKLHSSQKDVRRMQWMNQDE